MAGTEGSNTVKWSKPHKAGPSSDWRLKLAFMKVESLVIRISYAAVNMFLGLVHTARQATKVGSTRSREPNRKGGSAYGKTDDWD